MNFGRSVGVAALVAALSGLVGCTHVGAAGGSTKVSAENPVMRITTASGVRLRAEPGREASEVAKLSVGAVVTVLEIGRDVETIGGVEGPWIRVKAGDSKGWLFSGLTADFDAEHPSEAYAELARRRLDGPALSFSDGADLVLFLDRALAEQGEQAELAYLRYLALDTTEQTISWEDMQVEPYAGWLVAQEPDLVYSEPAGDWMLNIMRLWELEERHHISPIAEDIAWLASRTSIPGECEGYFPCYVYADQLIFGEYLARHPHGSRVPEVLMGLGASLTVYIENFDQFDVSEDRAEAIRGLERLRSLVNATGDSSAPEVAGQLEALQRRLKVMTP